MTEIEVNINILVQLISNISTGTNEQAKDVTKINASIINVDEPINKILR